MNTKNRKKLKTNVKKHNKCKECKLDVVSEDEDSLACDNCESWIHYQCTNLNKKAIQSIINDTDSKYECHLCNPSITSNNDNYKLILSKLNELTTTVKFLADKHDDFRASVDDHQSRLKHLEKENKMLRDELNSIANDQAAQFSELNKNKIIIKGIQESAVQSNDNMGQLVQKIASKIGSNITTNDISSTKLLNIRRNPSQAATSNQSRTAIIEFSSFQRKMDFVTKKKELRKFEECKQITVSDLLPKTTQKLYTHSLLLKSVGFVAVYHLNGTIFAKKTPDGRPIIIKSMDQIDRIAKKIAVNRSPMRSGQQEDRDSGDESS